MPVEGDKRFLTGYVKVIDFTIQNHVYNQWKNYFDVVVSSFALAANIKSQTGLKFF
jgi:hypothetical protein